MTKYPIDIENLKKGDFISASELEKIFGKKFGTNEYYFELMSLHHRIEMERNAIGKPVVVKTHKGGIMVLADNAASAYLDKQFDVGVGKMVRSHLRTNFVDRDNLTDAEKREHTRMVEAQGKQLQAVLGVREILQLEAHVRKTPKLKKGE